MWRGFSQRRELGKYVQRAQQHAPAAGRPDALTQLLDIAQVADAPAVGPPQRVDLGGHTPAAGHRWALAGGHEQRRRRATVGGHETVIADRYVGRERVDLATIDTVLEQQPASALQRMCVAFVDEPQRRGRHGLAHQRGKRSPRLVRRVVPVAVDVVVAVGDAQEVVHEPIVSVRRLRPWVPG
jgi:hypothetical protein